MNREKQPLYRKENKRALNFWRNRDKVRYRYERHSKKMDNFVGNYKPMHSTNNDYDYTPLFKFLLSKVGQQWDDVFSEAVSRLNDRKPIFWMVDLHYEPGQRTIVAIGEGSCYSKLTVVDGILVKADENATPDEKGCTCCTHTFNGVVY